MLKVGIIGCGNAGSQIAELAKLKLDIPAIVINTSEKDLQTIDDSLGKFIIGDSAGAGKHRATAQESLKESIMDIVHDEKFSILDDVELLFVASSTGGGTGSGTALIMASIIEAIRPNTDVIVIGVLPTIKEGLSTQLNTLEYMNDLANNLVGSTYMIYDNDKRKNLPSHKTLSTINEDIVKDIELIRGHYQLLTKYSSIDERDMMNIVTTSGRLAIASVRNLKEKDLDDNTIENLIIEELKNNSHAELQRDSKVHRSGIIYSLHEKLSPMFDSKLPEVQKFIGTPVEEFEHCVISTDRNNENNVFLILSGLSPIDDRLMKIKDRIDEIEESQKTIQENSALNNFDMNKLSDKVERKQKAEVKAGAKVDISNIFDNFMKK